MKTISCSPLPGLSSLRQLAPGDYCPDEQGTQVQLETPAERLACVSRPLDVIGSSGIVIRPGQQRANVSGAMSVARVESQSHGARQIGMSAIEFRPRFFSPSRPATELS